MGRTAEGADKALNKLFWSITKRQSGREWATIMNINVHKKCSQFKNKWPPNNIVILPSPRKKNIVFGIDNATKKSTPDDNGGYGRRKWSMTKTANKYSNGNSKIAKQQNSKKISTDVKPSATVEGYVIPVGIIAPPLLPSLTSSFHRYRHHCCLARKRSIVAIR